MTEEILTQLNNLVIDDFAKKNFQEVERFKTGKYKHIQKTTDNNGLEYSIHEYKTPSGDLGFNIFYYKTIENRKFFKKNTYPNGINQENSNWVEITEE